jgi:hypothetical protein
MAILFMMIESLVFATEYTDCFINFIPEQSHIKFVKSVAKY